MLILPAPHRNKSRRLSCHLFANLDAFHAQTLSQLSPLGVSHAFSRGATQEVSVVLPAERDQFYAIKVDRDGTGGMADVLALILPGRHEWRRIALRNRSEIRCPAESGSG